MFLSEHVFVSMKLWKQCIYIFFASLALYEKVHEAPDEPFNDICLGDFGKVLISKKRRTITGKKKKRI